MMDPKRKPKVLFLHQGGELYGSDIVFAQVVAALADVVQPLVVLDNPGPLIDRLRPHANEIIVHPLGVLRRKHFNPAGMARCGIEIIRAALWLARLIRREKVALVYTNTIGVLPGALAAKLTSRPHIWHVHEIVTRPPLVKRTLSTLAVMLSKNVIAVSNSVRDHLLTSTLLRRDNIVVVWNGIGPEPYLQASGENVKRGLGMEPTNLNIVLVGRIHFWKGQDYFLDVCKLMTELGFSRFSVLLVGTPYSGYEWCLEKVKEKIRRYELEQHVMLLGFRSDVPEILAAADVVVIPSTLPDPLPTICLEAMAAGKPVVAHAHGGLVEMIEDGVTGYLVPVGQPRAMAEKIIHLARNPELRAKMGQRGRERVSELFSPNRFREKIRKVVLEQLRDSG